MRRVVDTNVPIVANGRPDPSRGARPPSIDCRLAAITLLETLLARGRIVVDLGGDIQREYHRRLNPSGQPGVGDRFYLAVINSGQRIERVPLARHADGTYADFPDEPALATFDKSDRKFAALARRETVPVANATDPDWLEHRACLRAHGIEVDFICGCNPKAWFET